MICENQIKVRESVTYRKGISTSPKTVLLIKWLKWGFSKYLFFEKWKQKRSKKQQRKYFFFYFFGPDKDLPCSYIHNGKSGIT